MEMEMEMAVASAEAAAVAAAEAAAAVVRLTTSNSRSLLNGAPVTSREEWAAITIQTAFRGHLVKDEIYFIQFIY